MIVIVEGIDRVGKTTFCKKLEAAGFLYLKDKWLLGQYMEKEEIPIYSVGKLDTTVAFLKTLEDQDINVVVDRCHLTEWAYGLCTRKSSRVDLLQKIDWAISNNLNSVLVYVQSQNLKQSNKEAGMDLSSHEAYFEMLFDESSIHHKYKTRFDRLDLTVISLLSSNKLDYNLYFASPFFNPEQVMREEEIKHLLRKLSFRIYSPKEKCFLKPDANFVDQKKVFMDNCSAIKRSMAVFVITDGKDMGTIWEAGYAYGINKPILYFAETLGDKGFNLMLAQSGRRTFIDRNDLTRINIINAILGDVDSFRGPIE